MHVKTLLFKSIFTFLLFTITFVARTQDDPIPVRESAFDSKPETKDVPIHHKFDFGAGIGLDYGGLLGLQVAYSPMQHLIIFASGGIHIIDFGYEVGAKGLFIANTTKNVIRPYGKFMYGNNSVIVSEVEEYNRIYRGFTPGVGVQLRFGSAKRNGFDFDLNIPIRTQEFKDDYETMKNDPRVEITQDPLPVTFSIGYHHEF